MPASLLRLRVPLGFLIAAWYLIIARPLSLSLYLMVFLLVLVGCLLRSWAAGYLFKGKRVAVGGPYAFIRNPLYVGSFIIGLGFGAALWRAPLPCSSIVLGTAFIVGYGVIYPAKARAEEHELAKNLGEPYARYVQAVPRYLPLKGHVPGLGIQHFSAELYRRNREYQCLLGSGAILIYLLARYHYGF